MMRRFLGTILSLIGAAKIIAILWIGRFTFLATGSHMLGLVVVMILTAFGVHMIHWAYWRDYATTREQTEQPRSVHRPLRRIGDCPRRTPGCIYGDCSPAPGRSCYGPDAPLHIDMADHPWPEEA